MIFTYAQKQKIILKNPMDKVDPPKLAKKQVDALSPEAAKNFSSALNDCPLDFRCMLQLMITTGMRRGECIGLKWGDIDENRSLVKVERSVTYTAKSGITVSTPKTAASLRTIPLMNSTLNLLKALKEERKAENPDTILDDSFIFPGGSRCFCTERPQCCDA